MEMKNLLKKLNDKETVEKFYTKLLADEEKEHQAALKKNKPLLEKLKKENDLRK